MKEESYTIIIAKRVREKAEAFFETHEELLPRFRQMMHRKSARHPTKAQAARTRSRTNCATSTVGAACGGDARQV